MKIDIETFYYQETMIGLEEKFLQIAVLVFMCSDTFIFAKLCTTNKGLLK